MEEMTQLPDRVSMLEHELRDIFSGRLRSLVAYGLQASTSPATPDPHHGGHAKARPTQTLAIVETLTAADLTACAEHVARHHAELETRVHDVPVEIDREVARLKLAAMGVIIDVLTPEQERYLASWETGTS